MNKRNVPTAFKRLPFNFCALSLQPFEHPVCTADGTIFDLTNILPWLKKHGTNPVDGTPLKSADLIKLNFAKNEDDEYVDPVTYKVFTDNTHIVALKNTGNVFAYDTIERLNIKAKNWKDLVTDEDFSRKDIATLQDPQNIESRNISSFKYKQDGASVLTPEQEAERSAAVNTDAMGNAAKIFKAKEAVAKARAEREAKAAGDSSPGALAEARKGTSSSATSSNLSKPLPYNAAKYTTGKAAASFTSTGVSVHTGGERALLSDEEYMLKPKRVKIKGYARMQTNLGELNVELHTESAPKAVWNFIRLAQKGYYKGVKFHRNIKNFMVRRTLTLFLLSANKDSSKEAIRQAQDEEDNLYGAKTLQMRLRMHTFTTVAAYCPWRTRARIPILRNSSLPTVLYPISTASTPSSVAWWEAWIHYRSWRTCEQMIKIVRRKTVSSKMSSSLLTLLRSGKRSEQKTISSSNKRKKSPGKAEPKMTRPPGPASAYGMMALSKSRRAVAALASI